MKILQFSLFDGTIEYRYINGNPFPYLNGIPLMNAVRVNTVLLKIVDPETDPLVETLLEDSEIVFNQGRQNINPHFINF